MILNVRLAEGCFVVGHFPLSVLLLMNDARYPWFILVPQRRNISEIQQLCEADRYQLMDESCVLSQALREGFSADRINVAALGNVVSQLHVHHIARYRTDDAWPLPVWGRFPAVPYTPSAREEAVRCLLDGFPKHANADFSTT